MREGYAVNDVKVWTEKFWKETDGMTKKRFVEEYLKSEDDSDTE